jgi:hypothetical protein
MKLLVQSLVLVLCVAGFPGSSAAGDPPTTQGIRGRAPHGSESDGRAAAAGSPAVPAAAVEIVGTVTYKSLEGGFYAIDGDDGKKYDPVNLPEAFRKDGLRVKATARLKPGVMGFHMYGAIVEIVDIAAE